MMNKIKLNEYSTGICDYINCLMHLLKFYIYLNFLQIEKLLLNIMLAINIRIQFIFIYCFYLRELFCFLFHQKKKKHIM